MKRKLIYKIVVIVDVLLIIFNVFAIKYHWSQGNKASVIFYACLTLMNLLSIALIVWSKKIDKIYRKIYNKLDDKIRFGNGFKVFHLLDIGKINGNLIFSVFNIYFQPQAAPWVLLGIGWEKHLYKAIPLKGGLVGYLVLSFFGKQKRIQIKKR